MAGVGEMPKASPSADISAYAAMIARARALVPRLRERAPKTEELRRLPPETERDLHEAGLFRIVQPKRVGGAELDYVALVDCADVLAQGDASVAWNFANLASHHWMLGMFDRRAQDLVWDKDPDALIASSFIFPSGRARKVDGGYRLRGHWPFSSGVSSSDWNMLAASSRPTTRPMVSNTGSSCSTRTTTRSPTPGMRADCGGRDRTMSKSSMPSSLKR